MQYDIKPSSVISASQSARMDSDLASRYQASEKRFRILEMNYQCAEEDYYIVFEKYAEITKRWENIKSSVGFRIVARVWALIDQLLPRDSYWRKLYDKVIHRLRGLLYG